VDVSLIVDQRSACLAASERDVRTWTCGRRIFVSRLIADRLRVTWTPPRVYENGPDPVPMSIDGRISGP
jgi:hypothetical protein